MNTPEVWMDDGKVRAWLDAELNTHVRIVEPSGDPVELNELELEQLIAGLAAMLAFQRGRDG